MDQNVFFFYLLILTTCHPEDLPPLMTRPPFAIRRCTISTDNCAVMQCCTQTKFMSFFTQIELSFGGI
ncbi:unnamed protein product [Staurois parvus]|uniref:Secreted protein n=1 Tax=Staurois parvus TaxID=386267 RepID=A0ABN9EQ83_9NEOB|nr:unnamed protein product [Staurois parvus]